MVRLTIAAGAGGSVEYYIIEPDGFERYGKVAENTTISDEVPTGSYVTVMAFPKTGYEFKRWVYSIYKDGASSGESYEKFYTFVINYRTDIAAEFKEALPGKARVVIRVGSGVGEICVDGVCTTYYQLLEITLGSTITVNAKPSNGYELDYVLVNSEKYTFTQFNLSVTQDTNITAYFKVKVSEVKIDSLIAMPNTGVAPLTVYFSISWHGGTPPYSLAISYGDGMSDGKTTYALTESFTHIYGKAGTFTATVTVSDSVGRTDSKTTTITVTSAPSPTITPTLTPSPTPTLTPSPTPTWEQMMPMIAMVGALLIGGAIVISLLRG